MKAEYISHMGSDLMVVNAARVSFNKQSTEMLVRDLKLIRYLAKHNHWTPFGHPQICLRETVPIFVARQRFKHTVGFVYNEISRRYVDDTPEFFHPDGWRARPDGSLKQGSGKVLDNTYELESDYRCLLRRAIVKYHEFLKQGVAPEQARMVLPQSMYTSYYVTGSLAAWCRFLNLRLDSHAQKEIQDLAKQVYSIIHPLFPVSVEALCKQESTA